MDKDFRKPDCSKESIPVNPFFYTTKYINGSVIFSDFQAVKI